MTTYTVHLYRETRLRFPDVLADTPEDAARFVTTIAADDSDDTGLDTRALVDVPGEPSRLVRLRADGGEIAPAPLLVTNRDRSAWADAALRVFIQHTGVDRSDALGDLLCDLMHWAVRNEFDLSAALERALGHFEAELVEEGRIPASPASRDGRGRLENAATPLLGTIFHLLPAPDPNPEPTPGPWTCNDLGIVNGAGPGDGDGPPFVCDVSIDCSTGLSPRERANARLITCAPRLFDTLLDIKLLAQKHDDDGYDPYFLLEEIESKALPVLAQARGAGR